jgi:RNA polymerase sigma factor (TIGR02999 family)
MERLYDDLRRLAESLMRRESPRHTLQATALVHEAYLRLANDSKLDWFEETEVIAVAGRVMKQVLIDHDRGRRRQKRGGSWKRVSLDEAERRYWESRPDLVEGLDELAPVDPLAARVFVLRNYHDYTKTEIAEMLGISRDQVRENLRYAEAWLDRRRDR